MNKKVLILTYASLLIIEYFDKRKNSLMIGLSFVKKINSNSPTAYVKKIIPVFLLTMFYIVVLFSFNAEAYITYRQLHPELDIPLTPNEKIFMCILYPILGTIIIIRMILKKIRQKVQERFLLQQEVQERFLLQLMFALKKNNKEAIERIIEEMKLIAKGLDNYCVFGLVFYGELDPALEELLKSKALTNTEKITCLKQINVQQVKFLGTLQILTGCREIMGWTEVYKIYCSAIKDRITNYSNEELIRMVSNPQDYHRDILQYAKEEMENRNINQCHKRSWGRLIYGQINQRYLMSYDNNDIREQEKIQEKRKKENDWKCPQCNEVNDDYLLRCSCGYQRSS